MPKRRPRANANSGFAPRPGCGQTPPMSVRVYVHAGCDSCRRALKFLEKRKAAVEVFQIRETPPSEGEIKRMLEFQSGDAKRLFNTSGTEYRRLKIKERFPRLSITEIVRLLARNGSLVKRPFVIGPKFGLLGFDEAEWSKVL
jgi:arsenate reductase